MKVFNIILSVLVLLLSVLLAVSSYFLYEKRVVLLDGWSQLTTSMSEQVKTFDEKSGTKVNEKVNVDALAHTNIETLSDTLAEFKKSNNEFLAQRDQYVAALETIARNVNMKSIPKNSALLSVSESDEASKKIETAVYDFKNRRDGMANTIASIADIIGADVDRNALKNGDPNKALKDFEARLNGMMKQLNSYQSMVKELSKLTKTNSIKNNDLNATKKAIDNLKKSVRELENKYNATSRELAAAKRKILEHQSLGKKRDSDIKKLNSVIDTKNKENTQLKVIIGMDNDTVEKPWIDGSEESRKALIGKVIEINERFGFVVVDFGTSTRVNQRLGNKITHVDPKLENGLKFNIVRDYNTPDVKLVVKGVVATNVAEQCTIVEVAGDKTNDVKVGDEVIVDFAN